MTPLSKAYMVPVVLRESWAFFARIACKAFSRFLSSCAKLSAACNSVTRLATCDGHLSTLWLHLLLLPYSSEAAPAPSFSSTCCLNSWYASGCTRMSPPVALDWCAITCGGVGAALLNVVKSVPARATAQLWSAQPSGPSSCSHRLTEGCGAISQPSATAATFRLAPSNVGACG